MPAAGRPPVDHADHDLGHEPDQPLALEDVQSTETCLLRRGTTVATITTSLILVLIAGPAPDALVAARAEGPLVVPGAGPVAGEENTAHVARRTSVLEDAQQLVDRVWPERVEHVGAVEGDPDGPVGACPVVGQVGQVLEGGDRVPVGRVEDLADSLDRTHAGEAIRRDAAHLWASYAGPRATWPLCRNATPRHGVVRDMTLQGEYVPSKAKWVRDQVEKFEATDGAEANTLPGTNYPIVVITSRGAKSGNLRKNPVMRVERDGIYVAIASKGGADEQPEWYYNFLANPEVDLQDGPVLKTYKAEVVEGDERADLWQLSVDTWPTYASYQEKTERQIPVFKLTPID